MSAPGERAHVVVAGASGFIGTALCPRLAEQFSVTALTRSPARAATPDPSGRIRWRHCDLFNAADLEGALTGVDYAVYLVHSLASSSRLTQAHPRDMDFVLADNFARAAAANGIRQIVFVSAVMPDGFAFSPLLWSRREVEMVLASHGAPVTALRASLVVGPGGTGPRLLLGLVRRLPLLALPAAARSQTRPIALADLVRAILFCLGRPDAYRGAFDIGGADALSYEQMLRTAADVLGLRRVFIKVPGLPVPLASLVARLVSKSPPAMVGAIVESLPRDTVMRGNPVQQAIEPEAIGFRAALLSAIDPRTGRLRPNPRQSLREHDLEVMRRQSQVRSIQRILLPPGQDAAWIAGNYFRWLGRCCWPLVQTRIAADGSVDVCLHPLGVQLLSLTYMSAASSAERQVYRVAGGVLARSGASGRPRFEFQTLLGQRYTMAAIHDYAPSLPWFLYIPSQAFAHLRVMRRYQKRLARLAR